MKTAIKNIEKIRMYKIIAQGIMNYIVDNDLKPGDALMPESELSSLFNVSRTSVREGILYLETLGIVTSTHKDGIIVNETNFKTITDHLIFGFRKETISKKDLIDVRRIMEIGALGLAIEQLNETHFAKMKQSIDVAKQKLEQQVSSNEEDLLFHQSIFEATNNLIVEKLCAILREFFQNKPDKFNYERDKKTIEDHEKIYELLKNKQLKEAEEAMSKHLEPLYNTEYVISSQSNIYI